jgi:adenylate cyclase
MSTPVTTTLLDENGDPFEVRLVKRSFALLQPICRLGLVVSALFLCVADPMYHFLKLWNAPISHTYLLAWHASVALFFAAMLVLIRRGHSHAIRCVILQVFFAAAALLFVWFGVVSWLGTGDLSMVAIAQVLVAAALCFPGTFRRWTYGLQALAIILLLAWLDTSGKFLGQMQFANVLVSAAVAYAMDGYMLKNARLQFHELCLVAMERQRADTVLYNALPVSIANELKAHQRVKAQSFPTMAILFADIVGFTEFAASRTPDQVLDVLNALFSEMDSLVEAHGVEKIKTIGDAYMVISKTEPEALATLALSMHQLMQGFNATQGFSLSLRLGLHCGPAIAGVIGNKRFLYDVWGDAVNLASRMESSGAAGRIHTSEAFFQRLNHAFDFEVRGLLDIKGKDPQRTYFLLGAKAAQPRAPAQLAL